MVDAPDGRLEILNVHARNKKRRECVIRSDRQTYSGFTGADLANLLNEAAILTARRRKDAISSKSTLDRVVAGMEGTHSWTAEQATDCLPRSGHALIGTSSRP